MDDLVERVKQIDERLQKIEERLNKLYEKLFNHIDFVESIYDKIRSPFHYVMDKISSIRSIENS